MSEIREKCELVHQYINPCSSLQRSIDDKVLKHQPIFDGDMYHCADIITLHSGDKDRKKRGVVLNFCPFCKEELNSET